MDLGIKMILIKKIGDTSSVESIKKDIESYIKNKNYDISIGYYNINTRYSYIYNDKIYYGASTIKTLDALYYYNHPSKLDDAAKDRIKAAITVSSNDAHIANVNDIGLDEYRKYGEELGVS